MKYTMSLAVAVALAAAVNASATDSAASSPFLGVLTTATSAELPAKAASLVAKADAKEMKQTTIAVVKAAVGLNPAAAPVIVGSIAQSSPAMAATAAATAVTLVPNQAAVIARAAAAAAPTKAGAIVEALCRVLPTQYQSIANAVAEVVPGAGKEILTAIAMAVPALKDAVNQTLVSYDGKVSSVNTMVAQIAQTDTTAPSLPQGPTVGTPVVQLPAPVLLTPSSGNPVPTGGHNYATP